jgi:hypothetical protein
MKSVFISYAEPDRKVAEAVKQSLLSAGVEVWFAPHDIAPGDRFRARIVDAIESAQIVVLVLSVASNASRYVSAEIGVAFEKRKAIIALRIENVEPSKSLMLELDGSQRLDALTEPLSDAIGRLTTSVCRLVGDRESERVAAPACETGWALDADQLTWRKPGSAVSLVVGSTQPRSFYQPQGDWWSRISRANPLRVRVDRYDGARRTDVFEYACDEQSGLHMPSPTASGGMLLVSGRSKEIGAIVSSARISGDEYEMLFRRTGIQLA